MFSLIAQKDDYQINTLPSACFIPPWEIVLHQVYVQTPALHFCPSAGEAELPCMVQSGFLL